MMKNKLDLGFYLIPVLLFCNLFLRWEFTRSVSPDTYDYIDLAENLPMIQDSLFPIFYPICLKIINFITHDYLIAYKVVCGISLLFSLSFVRIKNFYWREIWVMFTFMSFIRIAPLVLSEVVLYPLLLLIFYYNHQFLMDKITSKKFVIFNSLLLIISVLTKYSSLFFVGVFIGFSAILFLIKDKKAKPYIMSSFVALLGGMLYLFVNYSLTDYAMGKRVPPDGVYYNIRLSFSQILFNLNPFFHTRTDNYLGFSFDWGVAYWGGVVFLLLFGWMIFRALRKSTIFSKPLIISKINERAGGGKILILNILLSLVFLFGTIYSYFVTKIDILDFRLLLGYYIPILFSVIVSLPVYKHRNVILLLLGLYCSVTNIINLLI